MAKRIYIQTTSTKVNDGAMLSGASERADGGVLIPAGAADGVYCNQSGGNPGFGGEVPSEPTHPELFLHFPRFSTIPSRPTPSTRACRALASQLGSQAADRSSPNELRTFDTNSSGELHGAIPHPKHVARQSRPRLLAPAKRVQSSARLDLDTFHQTAPSPCSGSTQAGLHLEYSSRRTDSSTPNATVTRGTRRARAEPRGTAMEGIYSL